MPNVRVFGFLSVSRVGVSSDVGDVEGEQLGVARVATGSAVCRASRPVQRQQQPVRSHASSHGPCHLPGVDH